MGAASERPEGGLIDMEAQAETYRLPRCLAPLLEFARLPSTPVDGCDRCGATIRPTWADPGHAWAKDALGRDVIVCSRCADVVDRPRRRFTFLSRDDLDRIDPVPATGGIG